MEDSLQLGRGKTWPKDGPKMQKNWKFPRKSVFEPSFGRSLPLSNLVPLFPHSSFEAVSTFQVHHRPLNGRFYTGRFPPWPDARKQPISRFPSLMGRSPTLLGSFLECLNGPFSLPKIPLKTAH